MLTTTIHHRIRTELGLTLQEYVVMDYLYQNIEKTISSQGAYEEIGITNANFQVTIYHLHQKELLGEGYNITQKWLKYFDYDAQFAELWSIHPKGTKKIAKKRWDKLKGKVDFEKLKAWLIKYVASKPPEKYCFLNGLDVILVPENRRWENPIIPDYVKQEERKSTPPALDFFNPKINR